MKRSQLYSLTGILLGGGAPLGAMVLRYLVSPTHGPLVEFVDQEAAAHAFFYWYMLLGTCLVLSIVGWLLGEGADREAERNAEKLGS